MATKVLKCKIQRKPGNLYFIDKSGDISMAKMARGKKRGGKTQKVYKCGIDKRPGYLYFVDKQGDISMAKMIRGGKKRKRSR
jgi:hypothetical protein